MVEFLYEIYLLNKSRGEGVGWGGNGEKRCVWMWRIKTVLGKLIALMWRLNIKSCTKKEPDKLCLQFSVSYNFTFPFCLLGIFPFYVFFPLTMKQWTLFSEVSVMPYCSNPFFMTVVDIQWTMLLNIEVWNYFVFKHFCFHYSISGPLIEVFILKDLYTFAHFVYYEGRIALGLILAKH